jgi:hypothetical protein
VRVRPNIPQFRDRDNDKVRRSGGHAGMTLKARIDEVKIEHIVAVIDEIRSGDVPVPRRRKAKKWHLLVGRRRYPTKYLLGRAIKIATPAEKEVLSTDFSGGKFTVNALRKILKGDRRFKIQ